MLDWLETWGCGALGIVAGLALVAASAWRIWRRKSGNVTQENGGSKP